MVNRLSSMARTKSGEMFTLIIIFIIRCALAQETIVTPKNKPISLKCETGPNSTEDVVWSRVDGDSSISLYTCISTGQCTKQSGIDDLYKNLNVSRSNDASILSLFTGKNEEIYKCVMANVLVKNFTISWIESSSITEYCNISLKGFGASVVTLSCGYTFHQVLRIDMSLKQLGENNFTIFRSSDNIQGSIPFEHFHNVYGAYCEIDFSDIEETRICLYPTVTKANNSIKENDMVIECDGENDIDWHLLDLYGAKEDIMNRSWIRDRGRSLLIRNITEQDVGKVVVCRAEGVNETNNFNIGFAVIPKIPKDGNILKSNNGGQGHTPGGANHNIYLTSTLLFLSLWVITTIVGGVFLWVKIKNKSDTIMARSSSSGHASRASNGGANELETRFSSVDGTRDRRDPDTTNTNNSAHNPAFEPETISIDGNRGNRQSNEGNHLYFTLEKSSPSPKTSTSRQERPGLSLNHPKGSQWQGYETVGDPNKGVFCSFDLGEYADVSFQGKVTSDLSEYSEVDATQFRRTAPSGAGGYSEVRRSFRGKVQPTLPDRNYLNKIPKGEQVERDEISRLYGKVKK